MGKTSNLATRIWLDQYDLSGYLNAADQNIKQELIPVTCFSDTGPRRIVGNYGYDTSMNSFNDFVDNLIDEIIFAHIAADTDHFLSHLWGANVENSIAYDFVIRLLDQPRSGAVGGAQLLNLSADGANGCSRGLVLRNATITGTGFGTGRNQGATTAGKIYQAVVRVFSGTFTSITIRIQESSDDGAVDTYADIATMTTTLTAAGVTRLTTTAATEAWKRVSVQAFTGTNAVIGVTSGVVAGS